MKKINKFLLVAFMSVISVGTISAQCTSSFTAVDNGNGNYTFTSTGSGGASFYWSIDNSYLGTGTSVLNTLANGTYNICLSIEDSAIGCSDFSCQTITVTSGQAPTCNADFSTSIGVNGYTSFTNLSSNYDYATWDYGDGTIDANGSHTYTSNGAYQVCLTVGDSAGNCTDTYCDSLLITNANGGGQGTPCNIVAGISYTDNGQGNYTFTSTSTGNIVSNAWSFGDGSSDFGVSVSHTFAANGTYVVALLSSDSAAFFGCYDYTTVTIIVTGVVNPVSCQAGFVIYTDSSFNGVYVVNSSTGTNLTYFWDFGDGNTSTLQYPNYTYTANGPFSLCLTVDNGNGCTSTYCDSIGANGIVLKQGGFNVNVQGPVVTGVEEEMKTVSNFNVFPNPFKNNVSINFSLVRTSLVEVYVTDLLGNEVEFIAAEQMNSGVNSLKWNASNTSNGIYLLNIKTGNSLQVKKLIVNK